MILSIDSTILPMFSEKFMGKVLNAKVLQRLFILHIMHEFTYRVDGSPLVTTILQIEFMDLEGMRFALA